MTTKRQVVDELREALAEYERSQGGATLEKLREFYAEMQRLGLVVKKGYDIPPMDTIGQKVQRGSTPSEPPQLDRTS